ncbi:hypothetical protein A2631_03510 [Candidatus Daviesbacteria bacterium RIFCSPHIGHO2_01_FULL_44_29]|uniref:Uncharacterized protein n=1 Tax=Candidatus Daviesbacteria bacterium RIFCSPHIGHO2_02_FULL_43_12 TaxID=1797776 RepID=A0A1F5KGJ4_9BACT|nr:MAG: hypothetical protein A2631_03510 [Candidatus Daviesbacteria bacterium RIFCSPHIGHO2_01_FULL_44_29]OGE38834.1 MAG: hypothetical protein A3E86_02875 [Candidatus Daviesbacteria bacterium RIFCSPHIGHO2_12_FULL_47_45]OGE39731.1 MAG: hypothetical protein A3D25_03315 [Candidatus Daviesbacteria bacterium RIFCSPHIGHO2_02_FULL_43_12]OGE69978.1 MAG: hypothetical protein A3B55_04775 [Candidatus Daviesbacteria bacterium RIFCSPLOWO2_01_FULL_43_15]
MINNGLLLTGLFIVELIFLFLLSRGITTSLSAIFYKLSHNQIFTINALALLFLPGTVVHELSHIFMAGMLMVHVGEMEFMPQVTADGVKLGSAEIGLTDPFRRALIGVAPLIFGTSLILAILWFFSSYQNIYLQVLTLFMIFQIGNTMFSSKKDLEGLLALCLTLGIFGLLGFGVIYFLHLSIPFGLMAQKIFTPGYSDFLLRCAKYLLIPIGIDLGIFAVARLLHSKVS